jgi:oxygen-independent coproporphyrinogen III oxidase
MRTISLYVHFPFCRSKCAYCDFNSVVAPGDLRRRYLQALLDDIGRTGASLTFEPEAVSSRRAPSDDGLLVTTIYFGGGTPTLYSAAELCNVLNRVRRSFPVVSRPEVTIEANPGTVTAESLALLREMGCNRLSLGVQSLLDEELRLLGRCHTAAEARRAVAEARAAGFDNLSLDLINALPGQTVGAWQATLRDVLDLRPQHLSCYGLSLEKDTPLAEDVSSGRLPQPTEDAAVEMYRLTHRLLTGAGYLHYEIANYALPGYQSRHNVNYWRNGEYLGLGAGAWSYLAGRRMKHEPDPGRWADMVARQSPTLVEVEELDERQRVGEAIMLALRTAEGLDLADLQQRYHVDPERFAIRIKALVESGLALDAPGRLVLHPVRGFLLQSEIAQMFM